MEVLDVSTMKKKPQPKTLMQLFTEDYPELIDEVNQVVMVCSCHKLRYCPNAWMRPEGPELEPLE